VGPQNQRFENQRFESWDLKINEQVIEDREFPIILEQHVAGANHVQFP
jgi:hypothetical protein